MTSITIHTCSTCEYYQEPFNDYPERGICECMNCGEYFCDECQKDHALDCWMDHSKHIESKCDYCELTAESDDIFQCKFCMEKHCYDCGKEHSSECCFG